MSFATSVNRVSWFALYVKTHHEKSVAAILRSKGYTAFSPLYASRQRDGIRFRNVELPLLSNYVFCRFAVEKRQPILTTPGVFFTVGGVNGPEPIPDSEIAALQRIVATGLRTQPWPFVETGDIVQILAGPLRSTEGIIVSQKGDYRLVVSISQ